MSNSIVKLYFGNFLSGRALKPTSGPWTVGMATAAAAPAGEDYISVQNLPEGRSVVRVTRCATMDAEDIANARLICAAPEMFEVVKELLACMDAGMPNQRCLYLREAAENAKRKALGDHPDSTFVFEDEPGDEATQR